jgi:hypothetical protein
MRNAFCGTAHIFRVPSVFVVGTDREVRFACSNPDYKVRLDPAGVREAAKAALLAANAGVQQ